LQSHKRDHATGVLSRLPRHSDWRLRLSSSGCAGYCLRADRFPNPRFSSDEDHRESHLGRPCCVADNNRIGVTPTLEGKFRAMSRSGKVTVVGAGFYGSTTALRLAEYDIFETVVLTDIVEGKPEGLALDINQSRSIEGFETKVVGATTTAEGKGYEATANSDVVVITAGLPRKPGMSRMDLIGVNAGIVRGVAENIAQHSPNAVLIVVSNPLDEMTALAQIASQFPRQRVMGQAGMLDTARFTHFVAEKLNVPVASVKTLTLGSHGDTMVPVPSRCTVDGKPLSEKLSAADIEDLVTRTRNGGAEVVALLKTGSAYYAPSAAAARMARAVIKDTGEVMPVCAWVDGEYGISGVYLGVEAEIGRSGIKKVVEGGLTASELEALKVAAESVRAKQADVKDL
jgi:malate dehydrogenase